MTKTFATKRTHERMRLDEGAPWKEGAALTYSQLDAAAAAAAASNPLANLAKGDRVIVAHPPGLEFSVAAGIFRSFRRRTKCSLKSRL